MLELLCLNTVNVCALESVSVKQTVGRLLTIVYEWASRAERLTEDSDQGLRRKIHLLCADIMRFVSVLLRLATHHVAFTESV